jgi:hypothetical protein
LKASTIALAFEISWSMDTIPPEIVTTMTGLVPAAANTCCEKLRREMMCVYTVRQCCSSAFLLLQTPAEWKST